MKIAQNTKYGVIDLIFINLETLEIVKIVGDSWITQKLENICIRTSNSEGKLM